MQIDTLNILRKFISITFLCFVCLTNIIAQKQVINAGWKFRLPAEEWKNINIPHTYNLHDAFDDQAGYYRGEAFYEKEIFFDDNQKNKVHYLHFKAANQVAEVTVNGQLVGTHVGGYTAFTFDISPYIQYNKKNRIEVKIDNSHNLDIPPLDADFTFWGGIYRDVELISVPQQHFSLSDMGSEGYYIQYEDITDDLAKWSLDVLLENKAANMKPVDIEISLFDAQHEIIINQKQKIQLKPNETTSKHIPLTSIDNPHLWSPDDPYLYQLELRMISESGEVLDIKTSSVGFHYVDLKAGEAWYLNGKPLKLIGVNRHQDFQGYGNAVPLSIQLQDLDLMKEMGVNFLRTAHYPQSKELYARCGELGIIVWSEIPVVNKVTDTKAFFSNSLHMQEEHIKQYYNYPALIMIGYMNEIFLRNALDNNTTKEEDQEIFKTTYKLAEQLENLTRKLAPHHITVMALHRDERYNESGIADLPMLVGWNLYFGWYHDSFEDFGIFLDDQNKRYPHRSLIISEYGPGADARIFTKTPLKYDFSREYQIQLHESYYKQVMERDFVFGMSAWNFADFGVEFRGDAIPHVNQKGIMNYDRSPKDVFYYYKSVLNKTNPFMYIDANKYDGITLQQGETLPVHIFSNQKDMEVFVNHIKIKTPQNINGYLHIDVPFQNGTNTIRAVAGDLVHETSIQVNVYKTLDFENFDKIGINLGSHFYFSDQEENLIYLPDQVYQPGSFGRQSGTAYFLRKDQAQGVPFNIKNTDKEPLYQTMLEDCQSYKFDIPKGSYKVDLFFVETQIKYDEDQEIQTSRRIFDIYINGELMEANFNMARDYPEKYGIRKSFQVMNNQENDLQIELKPKEGKPMISGILIEKIKA